MPGERNGLSDFFFLLASSLSQSEKSFQLLGGSGFNPYLDFIATAEEKDSWFHKGKGQDPEENLHDLGRVTTLVLSNTGCLS